MLLLKNFFEERVNFTKNKEKLGRGIKMCLRNASLISRNPCPP